MSAQTAKLFMNGRSQAVRLPAEYRFEGSEVYITKEGDKVILSPRPTSWDDFFDSPRQATPDFMAEREDLPLQERAFLQMALYLLDTDICSYVIRNRPPQARERMNAVALDEQAMSVVTFAELLYGVKRSSSARVNRQVVDAFVRHLTVIPWDAAAAEHYGDLRATLEKRGTPIGAMDLMIAAHARSLGAIMVTHNRRHFDKVPGLKVESWA